MKNLALVLVMALSMTACKKKYTQADLDAASAEGNTAGNTTGYANGQTATQANAVKAAAFLTTMYETFGSTSYNLSMVKFAKDDANLAVFKVTGAETLVFAIDISQYNGETYTAYSANHTAFYYLNDNGNGTYTCGASCQNRAGQHVTSTLVFEKTAGSSKDLEKAAAFVEAFKVESMAANLASQFGLSDDRSVKVAKLAASWEKLSKSRALTNADADAFSQELAGVSINDMKNAETAMINGSAAEMNAVLEKAAAVNGTTSENMSAIMTKLFF